MVLKVSVGFTHITVGYSCVMLILADLSHIWSGLLAVRWPRIALVGKIVLSSTWSLIVQKVSLGLVSWWWLGLRERGSVQSILKLGLRTGTPSFLLLSVGQGQSQGQLHLKGVGKETLSLMAGMANSHCNGMERENEKLENFFQPIDHSFSDHLA